MEQNIYTLDTAAYFYNSNFICAKMDMEKGKGLEFSKKYNITDYPSMLYLDAAGEVIHKTCYAAFVEYFIARGEDALNPKKQLRTLANQFNSDMTNPEFAYTYFKAREDACQKNDTLIKKYFSLQKDTSLKSVYNWKMIYKYADFNSKAYQYFENNRAAFSKLYTNDSVETKINQVYENALQQARSKNNEKELVRLKGKLRKLKTKKAESIIKHYEGVLEKLPNADMKNALQIQDSIIGTINVSAGFGKILDFRYEQREPYNTAWFKLTIEHDTLLTFDLVPIDSLDDYDFAIFKSQPESNLKGAKTKPGQKSIKTKLKPERLCYSYCTSKSGVTGLSKYADQTIVGGGPGPAYASGLPVKAGEVYYLMVNFPYKFVRPLGFSIYFYNYWPKRRPIILKNVLFENNKSALEKGAFAELDKLVVRMNNSQMKIEIQGHSDNKGDEQKNQLLSEERAKAVVNYLISKKVKPDRIFYKGLGSTKPIASNNTEEGRQKNRRVEFVIVMN